MSLHKFENNTKDKDSIVSNTIESHFNPKLIHFRNKLVFMNIPKELWCIVEEFGIDLEELRLCFPTILFVNKNQLDSYQNNNFCEYCNILFSQSIKSLIRIRNTKLKDININTNIEITYLLQSLLYNGEYFIGDTTNSRWYPTDYFYSTLTPLIFKSGCNCIKHQDIRRYNCNICYCYANWVQTYNHDKDSHCTNIKITYLSYACSKQCEKMLTDC